MKKKPVFLSLVLLSLFLLNFMGVSYFSNAATDQLGNFSISGGIPSGISNLYLFQRGNSTSNTGNYTYTYSQNTTSGHLNMTLAAIEIDVSELRDPLYTQIIANETSNPLFAIPKTVFDTPIARFAQYFVLDNFSLIGKVRTFLNFSTGILTAGNFQIDFLNASNINGSKINVNTHKITVASLNFLGWKEFNIKEYLEKGEYYVVFSSWETGLGDVLNNNSWCIENYSSPTENKGLSLFENSSGWFPIPDDNTADFLLELDITHYLSPYDVNLTAYINNETVSMYHTRDPSVKTAKLGRPVWRSNVLYYLDDPPLTDYNVSVTLNKSVNMRNVVTDARYIFNEPTLGTFFANTTSIKWNVEYKKVNTTDGISINPLVTFLKFPLDWMIFKLQDSFGIEFIEYGILYSYIYGEYGNAIWIQEGGDGTQTFEYSTTFNSPNYLFSGEITSSREVYAGDSFITQALIRNSGGLLITDGNCNFYLFDPDGNQIYSANKTNTNGVISSDELNTNGWALGTYSMVIFWFNGEEIGLEVYSFEVTLNPLIIIGIITAAAVASTAILLTYGRRKIAERHWEKSLHHLFVISKNGTPMYSFSFGITVRDSALISGMITALTSFVSDATGSKKMLRVIDQEDKKILLSYGKLTTVAIMASKDLPIIHKKAKEFIAHFEQQYYGKIDKWTGNVDVFKGANKLVEEYFPVSMEEILISKAGFELQKYKELIDTAVDNAVVAEILSKVTSLTEKYQHLIIKHYSSLLNEIINKAHTKLAEMV